MTPVRSALPLCTAKLVTSELEREDRVSHDATAHRASARGPHCEKRRGEGIAGDASAVVRPREMQRDEDARRLRAPGAATSFFMPRNLRETQFFNDARPRNVSRSAIASQRKTLILILGQETQHGVLSSLARRKEVYANGYWRLAETNVTLGNRRLRASPRV